MRAKRQPVSKQPQMFLCHSHADKPFVRTLARDLSSLGVHVWMDEWELEPGDSLHGCIGRALESAARVGVVLSPASVKSHWCRSELEQALTREKRSGEKIAIPLLHRAVKPPPFLEGRLYADFTRSYFSALTQVAGFLSQLPVREVAEAIHHRKPGTLEDAVACLEAAGWKGMKYIEADAYERVRKILRQSGIPLEGDEFEVVLTPKKRPGRRRPLRRRIPVKK
jgi:hypothetical protein